MRWDASLLSLACLCLVVGANGCDETQQVLGPSSVDGGNLRTVRLRHIHHAGSHRYPRLHRKIDIDESFVATGNGFGDFDIKTSTLEIERLAHRSPNDIDILLANQYGSSLPDSAWTLDSVHAPNISNKETILSFARMSANAYYEGVNRTGWKWKDISEGFNYTLDFGWEEDGLRGHVFVDEGNRTAVVALKGTSVPWLDDPSTTNRDLLNDNLFGSCCCAHGGSFFWKPVCDCTLPKQTCNTTCLQHELQNSSRYYPAARKIFDAVREQYPNADLWLTGHSLGGVVASMLGHTYGTPTITFETFPEALAASRLNLPTPPGHHVGKSSSSTHSGSNHIFHFGNTGDPIFMADCSGYFSFCSVWGYAFESLCHTGRRCVYDTVGEKGWRVEVRNHGIERVIEGVLGEWEGGVPECREVVGCADCGGWEFV